MLIQVEQVHFAYPSGVNALNGVSLVIRSGESVGLVGENGSGKSTLARHLNGLLRPNAGCVWVGDWQTASHSPAQMARRVAYVFQNPDEQLFRRRVWDEVAFGPQNLGYAPAQVRAQVESALAALELRPVSDLNPRDLGYSGRRRVALASALAMQTPVLVFDEPTAGLDDGEVAALREVATSLHQQGKTVLIISHDLDFLAENVDRLVLMRHGAVVLDAPAPQFFGQKALLARSGLVAPQMVRLSQCLGQSEVALTVNDVLDNLDADKIALNSVPS